MYIGMEVIPRLFCPTFSFSPVLIQRHQYFQKTLSSFKIKSQWKVIMYKWAGLNVLVQNKFCSSIHVLNQHLLVQSHQWKHQMNV